MTLVTVVVPTYNQSRYLPICLDNIWFQEWDDLEIIVVNDGSTDDTSVVLAGYLEALENEQTSYAARYDEIKNVVERVYHPRYPKNGRTLRVIEHQKNRGLSDALNTGFQAASGELCTFIASDDILLPGMISDLAAALEANEADFAYADEHIVDDTGRILRRFSMPDYTFKACFGDWYFCGVAKLYKRELHRRFGWYDPNYTVQDHEMYQRFAMGGAKFVHVPKALVNVRIHDKDRQEHNHSQANMARLYRESSELVVKARRFLEGGDA